MRTHTTAEVVEELPLFCFSLPLFSSGYTPLCDGRAGAAGGLGLVLIALRAGAAGGLLIALGRLGLACVGGRGGGLACHCLGGRGGGLACGDPAAASASPAAASSPR